MFPLSRIQLLKFAAGGLVVISILGTPRTCRRADPEFGTGRAS